MDPKSDCIGEFNQIIGHFCATCLAYHYALTEFDKTQEKILAALNEKGINLTLQELNARSFSFGSGHPGDPGHILHYETTQRGYRERISADGIDTRISANNCLVLIYHLWEDKYRDQFAAKQGVAKDHVTNDAFGELRRIRRSIIHNNSMALPECERNVILKRFSKGGLVTFTEQEAYAAFRELLNAVRQLPV